jgi:RNA polymerase sigma-70 factor (ECF subfamily)
MVLSLSIAARMGEDATELDDFDVLVRLHWMRVFRFALASLRDRDAAESIAQDCFVRAYAARNQFRGESSVQTWIMQIAVNLVRDFGRNRALQFWRKAKRLDVEAEALRDRLPGRGTSPEADAMLKEQVRAVWHHVKGLSCSQQTVFLLRFVEDMDLLEIVAATGMTEGTVKKHLFRAVRKIRERMGEIQ